MIAILAAAFVTVASFAMHYRQWRRGAAGHFILVMVPAALLFVVLPVPLLALTTILGFGRVGASGGNGTQLAVGLSFDTIRVLGVGCLACAVTMVIAGAVQWHATREDAAGPDAHQGAPRDAAWAPWLLGAGAVLTLPAGLLLTIAADVPRLTIRALEMTSGTRPSDPAVLSTFSRDISTRLVAATVAGGGLAVLVLAAVGAALVAAGRISRPRRPPRVTWAILGLIVLATLGSAVGLQRDLLWARRVSAAAAAAEASRGHEERRWSAAADPDTPLRVDGVYRAARGSDGRYRYWVFEPGARCWPYDTPADAAAPPIPPASGSYWTWQADGGTVTLLYSEHDRIVRTEHGSIAPGRDAVTVEGVAYAFIDRSRLRMP